MFIITKSNAGCRVFLKFNGTFRGELVPMIFQRLCAYNIGCLNLNEEQPILVPSGPNSFYHLLACQNEFDPQCTGIEYSLFSSSMHKELTKHGRSCMQNNQVLIKSHPEIEEKL